MCCWCSCCVARTLFISMRREFVPGMCLQSIGGNLIGMRWQTVRWKSNKNPQTEEIYADRIRSSDVFSPLFSLSSFWPVGSRDGDDWISHLQIPWRILNKYFENFPIDYVWRVFLCDLICFFNWHSYILLVVPCVCCVPPGTMFKPMPNRLTWFHRRSAWVAAKRDSWRQTYLICSLENCVRRAEKSTSSHFRIWVKCRFRRQRHSLFAPVVDCRCTSKKRDQSV